MKEKIKTENLPIWQQILSLPILYGLMVLKILIAIPVAITMLCNSVIQKATNK